MAVAAPEGGIQLQGKNVSTGRDGTKKIYLSAKSNQSSSRLYFHPHTIPTRLLLQWMSKVTSKDVMKKREREKRRRLTESRT